MKLRIRGNSVRLRLTQSEVADIEHRGQVEDRVRFPGNAVLTYRVRVVPDNTLSAEFAGGRLTVSLPRPEVERWLAPEEVSLRGEQALEGAETLKILVEKDFACVTAREGEDESDLFPNPAVQNC